MGSALGGGKRAARREIFGERCAGHVLHGEERDHAPRLKRAGERGVVVPVQIEYSAHVRMGDRARELNLALEARESGLVLDTHGLQRHPIPQVEILGFVDLAHAAGSDRPRDAISPRQHGPGFQARASTAGRIHWRPGISISSRPLEPLLLRSIVSASSHSPASSSKRVRRNGLGDRRRAAPAPRRTAA